MVLIRSADDCDDADDAVSPGAAEVGGNAADDDCDGLVDELAVADASTWNVYGTAASDALGDGAWMLDDLDSDAVDGLVVSAVGDDTLGADAGAIGVFDTFASPVSLSGAPLLVLGGAAGDNLGASVLGLDSWGTSGFAAGATGEDSGAADAGAVYWIDGYDSTGSALAGANGVGAAYDFVLTGASASGVFGAALAAADLDGSSSLVVGATGESTERGMVYVFDVSGAVDLTTSDATASLEGDGDYDHLGAAIVGTDLDADGLDDLLLCAPDWDQGTHSAVGACYVVLAADAAGAVGVAVTSVDSANLVGSTDDDRLGDRAGSVAAADLDGDGTDDLAVGMPGYDGDVADGGGVVVLLGGTLSGRIAPGGADMLIRGDGALGTAVAAPGDVDGDGVPDLLLGAPGTDAGALYLVLGGSVSGILDLPTDAAASWTGAVSGDAFGTAVAGLRDLDGDGTLDFAASAPGQDSNGADAGMVYLVPVEKA